MKQIRLPKPIRIISIAFLGFVTTLWMIYGFDILFRATVIALLWMILAEVIMDRK